MITFFIFGAFIIETEETCAISTELRVGSLIGVVRFGARNFQLQTVPLQQPCRLPLVRFCKSDENHWISSRYISLTDLIKSIIVGAVCFKAEMITDKTSIGKLGPNIIHN